MKFLKIVFLFVLAAGSLTSCQKDELEKTIVGTWEGHWGFDFDTPTHYEKWDLKKNGDMTAYNANGTVIAVGSWELDGFTFEAEYKSEFSDARYLFTGLYSDAALEIIGNWGEKPSNADGGTFTMHKE